MKHFFLLGGFLGCFLAFSSALAAGNGIAPALRNGAIGCLAGAVLLKGFHFAMVSCVRSMAAEKEAARMSDEAAAASSRDNGAPHGLSSK